MRKFFSQKSKHKTTHQHPILPATTSTLTGSSSLVVSPLTSDKDDETQIATKKQNKTQTTSSHLQHSTTIQLETNPSDSVVNSTSSESRSSEITNSSVLKQDEMEEKSKKLFVVVSGKITND
ncbi:unnamed protein product [Rotaria magnacalcarata]|uniref:Uncharacterized protein n=1 Tax=Rotaria magnacalcarata TaxID=392030 RepID=A0A8S2MRA3_9BILA|nr:unnamed protein product [Rotaria magnacalcarata]